jgi:hypothetical protein
MAEAVTMQRWEAVDLIIETEFPSVYIGQVEFLLREDRKGLSWDAAVQALIARGDQVGREEEPIFAAARERLRELETLTDDAIQSAARAAKLKLEEEEKERLLLKDKELFDAPAMAADFEHYKRLAYWNMHEANCLLLGKDPRQLTPPFLSKAPPGSPFVAEFHVLTGILTRAATVGLLGDKQHIEPSRLVAWAVEKGIDVPEALATLYLRPDAALHQGHADGDLQSSRTAPEGSSNRKKTDPSHTDLENELRELKTKLRSEKSSNANWRKTTRLMISGLLHANLRSPPRDKAASAKEVVDFLDKVWSRHLDENTVRDRMRKIEEIIDELQTDIDKVSKQERAAKQRN